MPEGFPVGHRVAVQFVLGDDLRPVVMLSCDQCPDLRWWWSFDDYPVVGDKMDDALSLAGAHAMGHAIESASGWKALTDLEN
jgi:hypothetical protein